MVQFPVRARDFSLLQTPRPTLGYVWAPIQCEPEGEGEGFISGSKAAGM